MLSSIVCGYLLEEHCAAAGLSRLGKLRPRVLLARAERKGHCWAIECPVTHTTPLTPCFLQADDVGPLRDGCVNHLANSLVQGLDLGRRSTGTRREHEERRPDPGLEL